MQLKSRTSLILLLCLFLFPHLGFTQISFYDASALLSDTSYNSGVAIAVVDINGDDKDDIVRLDTAQSLAIEYQTDTTFSNFNYGQVTDGEEWAICVADIDNDDQNDIITGGKYNQTKFYINNLMASLYATNCQERHTSLRARMWWTSIMTDSWTCSVVMMMLKAEYGEMIAMAA